MEDEPHHINRGRRSWDDTNALEQSNAFAPRIDRPDDTDALVKAALELKNDPRHSRLAVILEDRDPSKEAVRVIDVHKMTKSQKQLIVRKAMGTSDQDNEILLSRMRERMDRAGVELSKVEVRFNDLRVETEVFVGNRALPTVKNSMQGFFEAFTRPLGLARPQQRPFRILKGVSGVLKPGRMCLLLGPPGCGKTTLLQALAGKLRNGGLMSVAGDLTYNGRTLDSFVVERTAGYVQQVDQHLAELTVRETFNFAAWCQGVGYKADEIAEIRQKEKELGLEPDPIVDGYMKARGRASPEHIVTDIVLKVLGLDVCADTIVGNQLVRGISGGQRKRVTTGEVIVGPIKTLFLDEISTGLDSSSTFQIIKCIRSFCHNLEATVLCALLQPPPETYELFDDVMLMAHGHIVYFGPREEVMPFFEGLGFHCPVGKNVADFLQDVTLPGDQEQYWADRSKKRSFMSVREMVDAYQATERSQAVMSPLKTPLQPTERMVKSLVTTKYGIPRLQALRACLRRDITLLKRDTFTPISRSILLAWLAFLVGTAMISTGHDTLAHADLFLLEIFFAALISIFAGFGKIPETIMALPVFYRQRENKFFPAWCFAAPQTIMDMPLAAWETTLWVCITYFSIGFARDAGRFWLHWLIIFLTNMSSNAMFRACAAIGRDPILASTTGVIAIFAVIFSAGIMIARFSIPGWWIWLYWISPVAFSVRALAINEFSAPAWDVRNPDNRSQRLGDALLDSFGIQTDTFWVWLGILVLVGYVVVFNLATVLALTFLSYPAKPPTFPEAMLEKSEADGAAATAGQASTAGSKPPDQPRQSQGGTVNGGPAKGYSGQRSAGEAGPGDDWDEEKGGVQEVELAERDVSSSVSASPRSIVSSWRSVRPARRRSASLDVSRSQRAISQASLILPFQPVVLSFRDVRYSVDQPGSRGRWGSKPQLELLKGITGAFRPGVLTALMGASGAGKTTLMDVLADRKTGGRITGEQYLNGAPKQRATLARVMGYVEQNDIHSPQTTVFEALQFSARLRLARDIDSKTEKAFVENVLELVDLAPLRDGLVGLPGRSGLSVEQRKRLTIAVELVANPAIVFCDEPTSGLDARAAATVMRAIKNTVKTGRTVVCTIHQPSADIFEAFDELLLLQRGGTAIYAGPLGEHSRHLVEYFEGLGVPPIAPGYNPATWMLEHTTTSAEEASGQDYTERFAASDLQRRTDALVAEYSQPSERYPTVHFDTVYAKPRLTQYLVLLKRLSICYWRTPDYNWIRLLITIILGFVLGTLYWRLGNKVDSPAGVQNVSGAINGVTIFLGALYSFNVMPVVSIERTVFYREQGSYMYASFPFAMAQSSVELPYLVVNTLIYSAIVYWCIYFRANAACFWWFVLFLFLTLDFFTHVAIMCVALTPSVQIGVTLLTVFIGSWNLLSGFYIPKPLIPGWWIWGFYLNPLSWSTYGLIGSQLGDVQSTLVTASERSVSVAQYVKDTFDFDHSFIGWTVLILVGFCLMFRLVTAAALKLLNFQTR
ncbi:hypothetical protein WJX72_000157 [[Myrmecia] bisecta]|uniref:ABC transporter domain-containing protein n=1 Tax=[Myrmecia] bisecta TaxID=41462 RepID=A0AAW1Q4T5_9CHLO